MSDRNSADRIVWGILVILLGPCVFVMLAAVLSPVFALIGSAVAAGVIFGIVRYVNRRDDSRFLIRPPDAP